MALRIKIGSRFYAPGNSLRPSVAEANKKRARPALIRFKEGVDKNGPNHPKWGKCWVWIKSKGDYGYIYVKGVGIPVHRYSYEIHKGPIPSGLLVCHHCDNPSCVRPSHLFVGTDADNTQDKVNKGRQSCLKGEANGNMSSFPISTASRRRKLLSCELGPRSFIETGDQGCLRSSQSLRRSPTSSGPGRLETTPVTGPAAASSAHRPRGAVESAG